MPPTLPYEQTPSTYIAIFGPTKKLVDDFQTACRNHRIEAHTAFTEDGWDTRVRQRVLPDCSCCVVLICGDRRELSGKDLADLDDAIRGRCKQVVVVRLALDGDAQGDDANDEELSEELSRLLQNAPELDYEGPDFWEDFLALPAVKETLQPDEETLVQDRDKRLQLAIPAIRLAVGLLRPAPRNAVNLESFSSVTDEEIQLFIDEFYPASEKFSNVFVNALGMKFKRITPGSFTMGNGLSDDETVRIFGGDLERHVRVHDWISDAPAHEVKLTREIFVATYLTQVSIFADFVKATQYKTTAERNGSAWALDKKGAQKIDKIYGGAQTRQYDVPFLTRDGNDGTVGWSERSSLYWNDPGFKQTGSCPVVCVSFEDALKFIEWLNENYSNDSFVLKHIVGVELADSKRLLYRLLTEAEYEYVIRGGTTTEFFWGDSHRDGVGLLNAADSSLVRVGFKPESRFSHDDGFPFTSPVGRFWKNPFGIYDAVGNALSWTSDWYGPNYGLSPDDMRCVQIDPQGPETGVSRVLRGAAWCSPPIGCRSAMRYLRRPEFCGDYVGFRVAFEVVDR